MFYNLEVLSSKGKLARVWIAAHHENKLTKPQVLHTSIEDAIGKNLNLLFLNQLSISK